MDNKAHNRNLNPALPFYRRRFMAPILLAMLGIAGIVAWTMESEFDTSKRLTQADIDGVAMRRVEKARLAKARLLEKSGGPNGFDISRLSIPAEEILKGGPGRDGIPAISDPKFVNAADVDYLKSEDLVIGVIQDNDVRAYPLRILVWHEVVNDTVGGLNLAITYCPLCGTAMVFERDFLGKEFTFGVSGLLYQSDVLLYDHQTESLWSQIKQEAVSGGMLKFKLKWVPSELMTWAAWKTMFPESKVLSIDTGYNRSYSREAYIDYKDSPDTFFDVPQNRTDLPPKDWVVGVIVLGTPKAYPLDALEKLGAKTLEDTVGGVKINVQYDPEKKWARFTMAKTGDPIPHVNVYWFAWQAFYPGTLIYQPPA